MSTVWTFTLVLNAGMTDEQANVFDHAEVFANGDVSYTLMPGRPSSLLCDVEAEGILEAVASVAQRIRTIPGLRAVAASHDDLVTLGEAAQRAGSRSRESLNLLAQGKRGPGGFPAPEVETPGTVLYSWAAIADFLRALGDDVEVASRDLVFADSILRAVAAVEDSRASDQVLKGLGWPSAA
ncbi:hypothetical protein [Streptomyces sp. NPDC127112]|uniref:hypothetical protein n=1 Tax=Streptomyces sp. NPDC127112 TaxID=3345364 RepID=UPI00362C391F